MDFENWSPWRDTPSRYGAWESVAKVLSMVEKGIWDQNLQALQAIADTQEKID